MLLPSAPSIERCSPLTRLKELSAAVPYYKPNGYHALGAAAKLGYSEITDANLDAVLDALTNYARDQKAAADQPSLVDADGNLLPPL